MKVLEKHIDTRGFEYDLVEREGMAALVMATHKASGHPHWEVWHIQSHPDMGMFDRQVLAAESRPCAGQWGTQGWDYLGVEEVAARNRYQWLIGHLAELEEKRQAQCI